MRVTSLYRADVLIERSEDVWSIFSLCVGAIVIVLSSSSIVNLQLFGIEVSLPRGLRLFMLLSPHVVGQITVSVGLEGTLSTF